MREAAKDALQVRLLMPYEAHWKLPVTRVGREGGPAGHVGEGERGKSQLAASTGVGGSGQGREVERTGEFGRVERTQVRAQPGTAAVETGMAALEVGEADSDWAWARPVKAAAARAASAEACMGGEL